jgi:hypothetical protein
MCTEEKCCQKPKELIGKPEECSPEQIEKECSPEQIEKCHGDVKEHPCVEESDKK